jgi:VanZ family protein
MISRRPAWALTAAWALLIFVLSSIPGAAFPPAPPFPGIDKVAHTGIYAVLGALTCIAVRKTWTTRGPFSVLVASAFALLYGVTDELHQRFVPGRSPDVYDVAADGLGALVGATAAAWAAVRRRA